MVSSPGAVAIVPVNTRSRSTAREFIRPLAGIPLLAYSIEAGLKARLVDRVIVFTDDEDVAGIARGCGADVLSVLSGAPADAGTSDVQVVRHALASLEANGGVPDIVVQLHPSSPLRPVDCVDAAIDLLRSDSSADSVWSVVKISQYQQDLLELNVDGTIAHPAATMAQKYWKTNHVMAVRSRFAQSRSSMTGARSRVIVLDPDYVCEIDVEADWERAEWLFERFDRPFVRPGAARPLPERLRLIVFDFDGVMTDNRVWVGEHGDEWVACNRSDGLGLEELRRRGLDLLVLSTEEHPVVGARCRKLGLPCEQGIGDKAERLRKLLAERDIAPEDVIYVGNDVNDVDSMRLVGCGVAVADAHREALRAADVVLTRAGGHGAVRELCDRLVAHLSRRSA